MRAASIGVSVSATKSEIITEPATVRPKSRRNEPTRPCTKSTGTNTAATEKVAAVAAKAISRVPFDAAVEAASSPELAVPLDVLEHDDRVVDHDADRERHAEQRHRVEREARHVDQPEGRDQRHRNRERR